MQYRYKVCDYTIVKEKRELPFRLVITAPSHSLAGPAQLPMEVDNSTASFKESLRGGEYIPTHPPQQPAAPRSVGGAPVNTDRYIVIPKHLQHLPKKPTLSLKIVLE